MPKATITIVGLGKRGSSIGLALKKPELEFQVIGHDKDADAAKKARSIGAVDSTAWNLVNACEAADVVIMTIPFDQVAPTLKAIGHELRPGCVVLDASPFKQPVLQWAAEYLKEGIHIVGIAPGLNPDHMLDQGRGPDAARADLFSNSPFCIMPAADCQPAAVKTAQDVAVLLGADPYFLDPAEYDGVSTAVNLMPALTAAALMEPAIASPSWREMRRVSSTNLLHLSQPLEAGGAAVARAAVLNKTSAMHWLDGTIRGLQAVQTLIAADETDELTARLDAILYAREGWLTAWKLNKWEKSAVAAELPTAGSWFGQLLGFRGPRKPSQSADEK